MAYSSRTLEGIEAVKARQRGPAGRASRAKYRKSLIAMVDAAKAHPCADCGGIFPSICMDFDHRPGETKLMDVSSMLRHGRGGRTKLAEEMAKCDVVCANCHRIRTQSRWQS